MRRHIRESVVEQYLYCQIVEIEVLTVCWRCNLSGMLHWVVGQIVLMFWSTVVLASPRSSRPTLLRFFDPEDEGG